MKIKYNTYMKSINKSIIDFMIIYYLNKQNITS